MRKLNECRYDTIPNQLRQWSDEFQVAVTNLSTAYRVLFRSHQQFEQIDSDRKRFERENLLTMTIYMKDLTKEIMFQELTYSAWSLLCESHSCFARIRAQVTSAARSACLWARA